MEQDTSFSQLFHHCVKVACHDGVYDPQRFSDTMLAFYSGIDEAKAIRSRCAAGITMECVTDESEVAFSYTCRAFCRDIVAFDFFENDVFMTTVTEPERSPSGRIRYQKRTQGRVKLTIFLPQCVHVGISDIFMGQWSPVPEAPERILFLGDSITQGMTVSSPSQAYPLLISRFLGRDYLNQGVGGYVFDPASLREVHTLHATSVVVAYGTNDYHRITLGQLSPDKFRRNVEAYLAKLIHTFPEAAITVLSPIWRVDCTEENRPQFQQVCDTVKACACARGLQVIHGMTVIGHDERLYVDGIHPNDWGANMMAMNILAGLSSLRKGQSPQNRQSANGTAAEPPRL